MKFDPIDFKAADWKHLDSFDDRTVFQTREWLQFVSDSQNATPVLAELRDGNEVLGYFTGLTFSKLALRSWAALFRDGPHPTSASISTPVFRAVPLSKRWRNSHGTISSACIWRFPIRISTLRMLRASASRRSFTAPTAPT